MIDQKVRIVSRLIARNTLATDLKECLINYDDDKDTKNVLLLIAHEWHVVQSFDVSNYELFEIPDADIYCFRNIYTNERFDVYLNNYNGNGKDCTFGYVGCGNKGFVSCDAETAEEAIKNYCDI